MLAPDRKAILDTVGELIGTRSEIVFAYAHGSFVSEGAFRDLDIAVWVDPSLAGAQDPLDYEVGLSLALERKVRLPVDVKRLNEAPLGFRYHACRGILILSRDDEVRIAWIERVRDQYWDFEPVARRHLREVLRG
jgi:predicted nucleotidyltransferase